MIAALAAASGLLVGCGGPIPRSQFYGYVEEWNDPEGDPVVQVYETYTSDDGFRVFHFESVDDEGIIHGHCSTTRQEDDNPECFGSIRDDMLFLITWDSKVSDNHQYGWPLRWSERGTAEAEQRMAPSLVGIRWFRISGNALVCTKASGNRMQRNNIVGPSVHDFSTRGCSTVMVARNDRTLADAMGGASTGSEVPVESVGPATTPATSEDQPPSETAEERLRTLRRMFDDGLISQEEYDAKRREILDEM